MLLTRLWSEGGKFQKGKGGVETPDTSLVRRNQFTKRGRGGNEGEVWRPLTRLWSEETKRNRRGRCRGDEKGKREEGRLSSLTRFSQTPKTGWGKSVKC